MPPLTDHERTRATIKIDLDHQGNPIGASVTVFDRSHEELGVRTWVPGPFSALGDVLREAVELLDDVTGQELPFA